MIKEDYEKLRADTLSRIRDSNSIKLALLAGVKSQTVDVIKKKGYLGPMNVFKYSQIFESLKKGEKNGTGWDY